MLARTKPTIVVETLGPENMLKNHPLASSLSDASFGKFVRQLEYKCRWSGSRLVKAGPFYPSTKRCSKCGHVKEKMPLSQRTYSCDVCGLVLDRDMNAARNLASVAASSAETENACGETRFIAGNGRCVSRNQEPSIIDAPCRCLGMGERFHRTLRLVWACPRLAHAVNYHRRGRERPSMMCNLALHLHTAPSGSYGAFARIFEGPGPRNGSSHAFCLTARCIQYA